MVRAAAAPPACALGLGSRPPLVYLADAGMVLLAVVHLADAGLVLLAVPQRWRNRRAAGA